MESQFSMADQAQLRNIVQEIAVAKNAVNESLQLLERLQAIVEQNDPDIGASLTDELTARIKELEVEVANLGRQVQEKETEKNRIRQQVFRALSLRTTDIYKAIGYRDPAEEVRELKGQLKDLRQKHETLLVKFDDQRSIARENESKIQELNKELEAQRGKIRSLEDENKKCSAQLRKVEIQTKATFYRTLLLRIGVQRVAQQMQEAEHVELQTTNATDTDKVTRQLISYLREQGLRVSHYGGERVSITQEVQLAELELVEDVPFRQSTAEVLLPGFFLNDLLLIKPKVRYLEDTDEKERSFEERNSIVASKDEPGNTPRDEGTPANNPETPSVNGETNKGDDSSD